MNFKKIVGTIVTLIILSTNFVVAGAANLQAEKSEIQSRLSAAQNELEQTQNAINTLQEDITQVEADMTEVAARIEDNKAQTATLEENMAKRQGVLEDRLVAMQQTSTNNLFIDILLNSEGLMDMIHRARTVMTLLGAGQEILDTQQADLEKLTEVKAEIEADEAALTEQKVQLDNKQAELTSLKENQQSRVEEIQAQYSDVNNRIAKASQPALVAAPTQNASGNGATDQSSGTSAPQGRSFMVVATAYTPFESTTGLTATGFDIFANPNARIIAVDPRVIPLGTRVWVEGYGEAIAADTGGAIIGNKIDVLLPTVAQALQWGRRTVRITILD